MYMHVMIIIKEGAKNLDRNKGWGSLEGKGERTDVECFCMKVLKNL